VNATEIGIYVQTKNDVNGNPRRGWMVVNGLGRTLGFVDEGYEGLPALRKAFPNAVETMHALEVTPAAYRVLRRNPNGFGA
jgi:hypothetical protein